jgi:hypothetical protein
MPDYTSYNQFDGFSQLSYNIITHLILNDSVLWNLLKYPTADALSQTTLGTPQKVALIYKGQTDFTPYRVFTTPFIDDAFDLQQTQLRVYTARVYPETYVTSVVDFAIDIICHNKIAILSSAQNRLDVMFEHIMQALNGRDIESLGKMYFNADRNSRNSSVITKFNSFYIGYRIVMSANYAG